MKLLKIVKTFYFKYNLRPMKSLFAEDSQLVWLQQFSQFLVDSNLITRFSVPQCLRPVGSSHTKRIPLLPHFANVVTFFNKLSIALLKFLKIFELGAMVLITWSRRVWILLILLFLKLFLCQHVYSFFYNYFTIQSVMFLAEFSLFIMLEFPKSPQT